MFLKVTQLVSESQQAEIEFTPSSYGAFTSYKDNRCEGSWNLVVHVCVCVYYTNI